MAFFFLLSLYLRSPPPHTHPSSSCSYGHLWPIHLLLPLPMAFFFRFLFVFLFLRRFFFLSPFVFMVVPSGSSSSSASRAVVILLLRLQQKKMAFLWKNPIRIINLYGSYGLSIRMNHKDRQSVWIRLAIRMNHTDCLSVWVFFLFFLLNKFFFLKFFIFQLLPSISISHSLP